MERKTWSNETCRRARVLNGISDSLIFGRSVDTIVNFAKLLGSGEVREEVRGRFAAGAGADGQATRFAGQEPAQRRVGHGVHWSGIRHRIAVVRTAYVVQLSSAERVVFGPSRRHLQEFHARQSARH
jgi:hypothetical protein